MTTYCWHFLCADRDGETCMRNGEPFEAGRWYEHGGELALCSSGYHASERLIDALGYAQSEWLCLCEIDEEAGVVRGDDKLVARRRRALFAFDATEILRQFARLAALSVIHLWEAPQVVRDYLESGDESIRTAAGDAARAAGDAARAAGAAARDAAWDAARAAARAAARDAAWAAARDAAWDAAGAAAWADLNAALESMVLTEAERLGLLEETR